MTDRPFFLVRLLMPLLAVLASGGCGEKNAGAPATRPAAARPTVASLVPGATDLIVGMGAADHLVAVSTYDLDRDGTRGLPRVGDYQGIDWEQLSVLRPEVLIVFMAPDRMPQALRERAESLNVRLVNVKTERLDDVYGELTKLGELLDEQERASEAASRLKGQLTRVQQRVSSKPRPRTLVAREVQGDGAVGRESFIDDVLTVAGGTNALDQVGWPTIDRESLIAAKPEVILHLLPGASPQVVEQAKRVWATMPELPAVKDQRVYIVTEWFALQPGLQLGNLAERFAALLHPDTEN